MAQLLIELFCEEIPARMQARAEDDLARLMGEAFKAAGLGFDSLETFSGPRRIGLVAEGVPARTADVSEERKGPRVGSPDKAVEGFLRGAGLESLDQCRIDNTPKGDFYVALIEKPGRDAAEVIAEALEAAIRSFLWPKSMKFGEGEKAQRWVRPLHRIICLLDGAVVPLTVFGIEAANLTEGHRIHSKESRVFAVKDYADYAARLRDNGVVLTRAERSAIILEGAKRVCADAGLELIEDEGLLAEVTGLAEWPVAVLGEIDPAFLDLPAEVIALTMKVHQKYFAVRDPKTGAIAPKFVKIANQDASDGGKAIAHGAARVVSARLSDARHFWNLDRKRGLDAMAGELSKVTFHEKLGTLADKVERVAALARELAPAVGADRELAYRAAKLAKADLVSQMVYEFPELQGVMGRYYALAAGEPAEIADAIRDHYKPQGPSDAVPTAPVSAAVALADKLDTLVGFWAIDEKPTGSKDPFALRRAALGVIRILMESNIRLALTAYSGRNRSYILQMAFGRVVFDAIHLAATRGDEQTATALIERIGVEFEADQIREGDRAYSDLLAVPYNTTNISSDLAPDLLSFFADRLKVHLRDEGIRHDVIDAVFAPRLDGTVDDDLVRVTAKSRALQAFLDTEDGAALLAGYRRAANILKIEEKKDGEIYDGSPDTKALVEPAETALADALMTAEPAARAALEAEKFESAMRALASLRAPVDAFFEAVTVNADDPMLRRNRLVLLSRIRAAVQAVADFDRLEG
ncbi:glycine--tRNA ligase beta subunit [Glycocaulis albus]|uniref:Glycine--tRNA ligase beta subunit n=1 Tax=Glycocaulis albus TaxID=1382801 RepID=A0ABQ1XRA0_9PROT|nr:glycine--tRNA ligase subunit beta [Glycocaulis albus]GGH00877.1 glycine--tRNA ligase beta subunit [Glycocaulis albus]